MEGWMDVGVTVDWVSKRRWMMDGRRCGFEDTLLLLAYILYREFLPLTPTSRMPFETN